MESLLYQPFSKGLSLSAVARIVLLMGFRRPRASYRGNSRTGGGAVCRWPALHAGGPDGIHSSGAWRRGTSHDIGWSNKDEEGRV